eukprot:gene26529-4037_t
MDDAIYRSILGLQSPTITSQHPLPHTTTSHTHKPSLIEVLPEILSTPKDALLQHVPQSPRVITQVTDPTLTPLDPYENPLFSPATAPPSPPSTGDTGAEHSSPHTPMVHRPTHATATPSAPFVRRFSARLAGLRDAPPIQTPTATIVPVAKPPDAPLLPLHVPLVVVPPSTSGPTWGTPSRDTSDSDTDYDLDLDQVSDPTIIPHPDLDPTPVGGTPEASTDPVSNQDHDLTPIPNSDQIPDHTPSLTIQVPAHVCD